MTLSILELAANVRQKKLELDTLCADIRHRDGEWVGFSIGAEEAMKIADDGLRNCWVTLDRLASLARDANPTPERAP